MAKKVVKEVIIVLLLCIAIMLILGVLLYEFIPNNKTLPQKVSYVTSDKVTQALIASGGVDESQVVLTYELNSSDLNNYQRINNYTPGKTNPFSSFQSSSTSGEGSTSGSATGAENGQNGSTNNQGANSNNSSSNTNDGSNNNNTDTGYSKPTDGK